METNNKGRAHGLCLCCLMVFSMDYLKVLHNILGVEKILLPWF